MKKLLILISLIMYVLFCNISAMEPRIEIDPVDSRFTPFHVSRMHKVFATDMPPLPYGIEHNVPTLQQDSSQLFTIHDKDIEKDHQKVDSIIFGEPGLKVKNIRLEEGTNCGYHALHKSVILVEALLDPHIDVSKELKNPNSTLFKQLNDRSSFIPRMIPWVHEIYTSRKAEIHRQLGVKKDLSENELKERRTDLNSIGRTYVNMNDGHIKTDMLADEEIEKLIAQEESNDPTLKGHLMVLTDQTIFTDPARIQHFKAAQNDTLAIIWTESGFNHWVTYVGHKVNGNVTVYKMSSIDGSLPGHSAKTSQYDQMIVDMLMPATGTRLPTIPLKKSTSAEIAQASTTAKTSTPTHSKEDTDTATKALLKQLSAEHEQVRQLLSSKF